MNVLLQRILKGEGDRPTRFHDERGNLVSPGGCIFAPHSLVTAWLRHSGYRARMPRLSYRGQRYIARLLRPDWSVLEFGSGMSTAWLARRCRRLYSREHDPRWYGIVQACLSREHLDNVTHSLRDQESYVDLSEFPDRSFDFVLIDGIRRADCVKNVIRKVRPYGWIYLDNTDRHAKSEPDNDFQHAEHLLLSFVEPEGRSARCFSDFVPGDFMVKQGLLVCIGER